MSAPAQVNTLRASDFPKGLASRADVDKLFQILNPFLQAVQGVTAKGTSLAQNIDGQKASFTFTSQPVGADPAFVKLKVRLADGKHPQMVLCWAQNLETKSIEATWNPAWTYLGQGATGNLLQIDNIVGLTPEVRYTVNLFIFF